MTGVQTCALPICHLAFYKTVGIPMARNIVLKELGLEPRYVPAADETLAWDQLPDQEVFHPHEAAPLSRHHEGLDLTD